MVNNSSAEASSQAERLLVAWEDLYLTLRSPPTAATGTTSTAMSPSKPSKDIKIQVPRHNSQRLGPAVTAEVEVLARQQNVLVDVRQTAYDPTSALAQAIDSASEWNSLLMTARAERGPQWDIGTQQYALFSLDRFIH